MTGQGVPLHLTGNGIVLSYDNVPVKYLQQPRKEGGYVYPGSSEAGAGSSSEPGRGSMDPAPGKAKKGSADEGGREGVPSEPPQSEAFDTPGLRNSIDEVEQLAANETMEIDMRVNTAKVHVEQQETLLRQTGSNPWFLFNQDVLALKDAKGNKVYSDYGDARAARGCLEGHACSFASASRRHWSREMVAAPRQRLQCTFLLRAFELGKMQGNFLIEFTKERKYTRNNRLGEAVLGYQSVFGDIAGCVNYLSCLIDNEFNVQATLQFDEPDSNDPKGSWVWLWALKKT